MKSVLTFYLLVCVLGFIGCKKSTTPITTTQISLTAEYVGVTEAELHLQVDSSQPYNTLQLLREGQPFLSVPFSETDTTLLDTTLFPAHTYTYQAAFFYNDRHSAVSDELTITTMDTTSHDFRWEIFTFESPYGSGMLNDIAIIDENNIWAVGEIYADSSQPWVPYNAVHWNGHVWEMLKIPHYYQGSISYLPLKSIIAFSSDDIWFEAGIHWDGIQFRTISLNIDFPSHVNKMWGLSSNDLYIIGNNGLIAHYDGHTWQKLESGTDLPMQDIWGVTDSRTGKQLILCVASDKYHNLGMKVIKIEDYKILYLPDQGLSWSLSGIWFIPYAKHFICGAGIFQKKDIYLNHNWAKYNPGLVTNYFTNRIRGIDINDVIAVGAFGEIVHYNGMNWYNFPEVRMNGSYFGVDIKENIIVAVGQADSNALIALTYR